MKAKEVWYEKKFNTAVKYENETYGILVELGEGERAIDILPQLKKAVHKLAGVPMSAPHSGVLDHPDDFDIPTEVA